MELAKQILNKLLHNDSPRSITIDMPASYILEMFIDICYTALNKIHSFVVDEKISDFVCIEKIVEIFNRLGVDCSYTADAG